MKPSSETAPMYLYVMSADGRLDASPCKVGISRYPSDRLETVRRGSPWADDTLDFVAVYEGDPGAIITLEDETKRAARGHALDGSREWFGFQASVLVNAFDDDPRCERAPKEVTETTARSWTVSSSSLRLSPMSEPEPYEDRLIGVDCYNCPVGTYERGTATETHALEDLTLPISRMVSSRGILRRC